MAELLFKCCSLAAHCSALSTSLDYQLLKECTWLLRALEETEQGFFTCVSASLSERSTGEQFPRQIGALLLSKMLPQLCPPPNTTHAPRCANLACPRVNHLSTLLQIERAQRLCLLSLSLTSEQPDYIAKLWLCLFATLLFRMSRISIFVKNFWRVLQTPTP